MSSAFPIFQGAAALTRKGASKKAVGQGDSLSEAANFRALT
jgi:hypothetical protein